MIEGMFSFSIYNLKTKELFCARDRIGKKPFVYSETPFGFVFASEIPAISKRHVGPFVKLAPFRPDMDHDGEAILS